MCGCTEAASLGASLDAHPHAPGSVKLYQAVLCLLNAPRKRLHRENGNFCQNTGNPCMTTPNLSLWVKLFALRNPPGAAWSCPLRWTREGRAGRLGCSPHSGNSQSLFPTSTGAVAKLTGMAGGVWCSLPTQCLDESQCSSQPREEQRIWMQH